MNKVRAQEDDAILGPAPRFMPLQIPRFVPLLLPRFVLL